MSARRKMKDQNVSAVASNLGYGDWKVLSNALIQFWGSIYTKPTFLKLHDDELRKLAHDFVQQKGHEYWNGTDPRFPIWPENSSLIWASVTEILKRQRRNQNDRAARRQKHPRSTSPYVHGVFDGSDDGEFEEDTATDTHQERAASLLSDARSGGPELRANSVEQRRSAGFDPHDRNDASGPTASANTTAEHPDGRPQSSSNQQSVHPAGFNRPLQPDGERRTHSSLKRETPSRSKEEQTGEPILYDVLDQLRSLERGKASQFLQMVLDMMQSERVRVKMKQRRAVTEEDKIVARAEANLLRDLCEKIEAGGVSLGSQIVME
ncbi:hypothetical protein LTR70_008657 [Exophiala xenobiotica]|uniref:Uncharacterized protein n=1 Tax=Lithohypha guttulata TaxID=1690604 RepID=A0ABR0JWB3_9EURO|nr:hypothetical protein LTR24_009674 [Lithohypha guttulata]KAK5311621.1 hypothetical protein LTR70_008657 [Exophiala xenobiotica]